ncbi:hypothetical protein IWW40_003046 [Coemansia sp. RSA 1250]|nr:hypothetical protein IWW40_003046 [Coemansia sp. RSA 1250]
MSDDEDAQPKTLAERIARLGLGNETARPASRMSQSSLRLTPKTSTETELTRPAVAAKPAGLSRPPAAASRPQAEGARAPIQPKDPHGDTELHASRNNEPAVQARHDEESWRGSSESPASAISVRDRIQSLYGAHGRGPQIKSPASAVSNPFASPELSDTQFAEAEAEPVSPLPSLPSAAPRFARRATDVTQHPPAPMSPVPSQNARASFHYSAESTPRQSVGHAGLPPPPPPPQTQRSVSALGMEKNSASAPPQKPPKPAGLGPLKSPAPSGNATSTFGRSQSMMVPMERSTQGPGTLPPLPAPPQAPRAALPPPPPPPAAAVKRNPSSRASMLPPPPPPPPPLQQALSCGGHTAVPDGPTPTLAEYSQSQPVSANAAVSRQSSSARVGAAAAASNTTRTALDFSNDATLRPQQPSYRGCSRRPPTLGVQPFLSLEAGTGAVLSCLGGQYSVIVHQARVLCTRIDTGEIGAIHNAPGPEERFVSIAAVTAAHDPAEECSFVWACTSLGRVLVLSTSSTSAHQEQLQAGSRAQIVHMMSGGAGEVWTVRDDGLVEVWRDRSAGGVPEGPLTPQRRYTIGSELLLARRAGRASLVLTARRELWVAGGRSAWMIDTTQGSTQSVAAPAAVQLSLTANDAAITCVATNTDFLDDTQVEEQGFVFAGTDAGHVVVWRAATRERWRTLDVSNGERDVRVTALACVTARWLWVGLASGRMLVVDAGDAHAWAVAKEWPAADSAVVALHMDWTPLLTSRPRLQVASVHANGSVFYWDGALALDAHHAELRRRMPRVAQWHDIAVQINSWNIGAVKPEALEREDRGVLARWLRVLDTPPELLVVGLQEVVDLESKKMTAKSLWRNTTGKSRNRTGADISKRYGLWRRALEKALTRNAAYAAPYRTVECQNMVGLFVCVFARDDVYRLVHDVDVSLVKTGMGGLHGNKGAIAVRVVYDDTSLCFVNAHLAAGESPGNNLARIQHCATIVRSLAFKRPAPEAQQSLQLPLPAAELANVALDAFVGGGDGQRFLDHAACFFSGDLNFRLRTSRLQAERYVAAGELDSLLQFDQLLPMLAADSSRAAAPAAFSISPSALHAATPARSRSSSSASSYSSGDEADDRDVGSAGFALRAFHEMPIRFAPTYKYDPGTDRYDTSEKRRTPAWCDRVLFRPHLPHPVRAADPPDRDTHGHIAPLIYQRFECLHSDHRPIFSAFRVCVKHIDRDARCREVAAICADYAGQALAELVASARVLWLARHTASRRAAADLLVATGGDFAAVLHQLHSSKS